MRGELIALVPISFQFDFRNDIRFFGERKDAVSFTYRFCSVTLVEEGRNTQ
jgi:hypothetical protein